MQQFEMKETLLRVSGVSKSYNVPVLRDISFEVKNIVRPNISQGQIISLVGKSGGGKSTLFRILAGLEEPDSGTIELLQDPQTGVYCPVREGDMGVVFQNSYIYPWRRVKKLLTNAADRGNHQDIYDQLIKDMDIEKLMDSYPQQLSGGQRQRVAIAEQILNGGDYILMDEPFSGLDTLTIDKVIKIITDLAATDEHKTIVLVSHDLSNSLAISDTAFILSKQEGLEGSTITHQICLATEGLAWRPDIKDDLIFRDLLKKVKTLL